MSLIHNSRFDPTNDPGLAVKSGDSMFFWLYDNHLRAWRERKPYLRASRERIRMSAISGNLMSLVTKWVAPAFNATLI